MAMKQTVIISKKITFTNVNLKNFVYTIIGSAVRHNAMSYLRNALDLNTLTDIKDKDHYEIIKEDSYSE